MLDVSIPLHTIKKKQNYDTMCYQFELHNYSHIENNHIVQYKKKKKKLIPKGNEVGYCNVLFKF